MSRPPARAHLPLPTVGFLLAILMAFLAANCEPSPPRLSPAIAGGRPERGAELIESYGCGACHVVPGVRGADGTVGPPLTDFAVRGYIAGQLPNNGRNLVHWIMDPDGVEPGTAMPDLGVTEAEARDIAAYLFTLEP